MGNGSAQMGIALYETLADISAHFDSGDDTELPEGVNVSSLAYGPPWEGTTFEDLDAIELGGMPLAHEEAYPALMRASTFGTNSLNAIEADEFERLYALVLTLPDFALGSAHMHASQTWPQPAKATLKLPDRFAHRHIELTFPAPGFDFDMPMRGDPEDDEGALDEVAGAALLGALIDDLTAGKNPKSLLQHLQSVFGADAGTLLDPAGAAKQKRGPARSKPAQLSAPPRVSATDTDGNRQWARVKVTLRGVKPPIWRSVIVPVDIRLDQLHDVIQIAFGWMDAHLHQFVRRIGGQRGQIETYGPDVVDDVLPEDGAQLNHLIGVKDPPMIYEYDFGDSWEHEIFIEALEPHTAKRKHVECVGGARACPPEDIGGVPGYMYFVEIMANPRHPEHKDMKAWYDGGKFDPAAFDIAKSNSRLKRIKI